MTERVRMGIYILISLILSFCAVVLPFYVPFLSYVMESLLVADVVLGFVIFLFELCRKKRNIFISRIISLYTVYTFFTLLFSISAVFCKTIDKGMLLFFAKKLSFLDNIIALIGSAAMVFLWAIVVFVFSKHPLSYAGDYAPRSAFKELNDHLYETDQKMKEEKFDSDKAAQETKTLRENVNYLTLLSPSAHLLRRMNYLGFVLMLLCLAACCLISEFQSRIILVSEILTVYLFCSLMDAFIIWYAVYKKNRSDKVKEPKKRNTEE